MAEEAPLSVDTEKPKKIGDDPSSEEEEEELASPSSPETSPSPQSGAQHGATGARLPSASEPPVPASPNARSSSGAASPADNRSRSPSGRGGGNVINRFVRKLVSKKKNRLIRDGYDLDMTYVTERIIAMGFPTEDDSFQSSYRNPFSEVFSFLEQFHQDHYKVYNLCSERHYDPAKFNGRVGYYPFDDHHCPQFSMITAFCEDAKQWLDQDEKNIIAVHCKAGKGRTGLMISSYLIFGLDFETADAALKFYGDKRTSNGKGVTIPSQVRYVQYFFDYLKEFYRPGRDFPLHGVPVKFKSIIMSSIPHFDPDKGSDPYVLAYLTDGTEIYNAKKKTKVEHFVPNKKSPVVELQLVDFPIVKGDVLFMMYDHDPVGQDDKMCYFWLHTSFLHPESSSYEMKKPTVDIANKDKKNKHFDKNWTLTITYEFVDVNTEALHAEPWNKKLAAGAVEEKKQD